MTVCIAAVCQSGAAAIVFCVDMMVSQEWTSSETGRKFRRIGQQFWALLAGPLSEAEELTAKIGAALRKQEPQTLPELLKLIRACVGDYRLDFAEDYLQSTLAISYADFRKKGKAELPEDLRGEIFREIKAHRSGVELIVLGFFRDGAPVLVKVSWEKVWRCHDFAVIGTGTGLAEAALFQRSQHILHPLHATVYQVYEAKRLAEKAVGVGKRLALMVLQSSKDPQLLTDDGVKFLAQQFVRFGARQIKPSQFPESAFVTMKLRRAP
jgi:20S proteasome alpha/beta subunit